MEENINLKVNQKTPLNAVINKLFKLMTDLDEGKAIVIIGYDENADSCVSIAVNGKPEQLLIALAIFIKHDSESNGLVRKAFRLEAKRIIMEEGIEQDETNIKDVIEKLLFN